ncbi:MAG: antirestriction protein ArdA [Pseudomonadota bacterium]
MTTTPQTGAPLVATNATARPRIYVACLAAYNSGRLHGRWIEATTPDDIRAQVRAMLADSPEPMADKWALHDHEGFEGASLSEWASFDTVHVFWNR